MSIYTINLSWGDTIRVSADLVHASAPISIFDDDGFEHPTQYQTADARHSDWEMARLVVVCMGRDWWLSPDAEIDEDEDGIETIDGMSESGYIDSLIVDVEREDDALDAIAE